MGTRAINRATPRPTTIKARFDVPWPRPRKLTGQDVQALKESILSMLGLAT